jgi:hypothetical protein
VKRGGREGEGRVEEEERREKKRGRREIGEEVREIPCE